MGDVDLGAEAVQHADVISTLVGFWDWDMRTDSVHYSDRFKTLLGYAPDELSASLDDFWRRCHPEDEPRVRTAIAKHQEQRVPYLTSFRLQTKSGEYRWFRSHGQALWDDSCRATRMFGYIVDISEQKRYEEALVESEELFRSLMEQSPLAIELLTPDGKIGQVNAAWKHLWGASDEEATQVLSSYNMLTDEQVAELGIQPLVERAFSGEPVVLPPIHYDGAVATEEMGLNEIKLRAPWIQCHLYPIKNADGRVTRVVNTYMDITDLKWAEQDAREQRDALARVGRATLMGQLTGSISHELNQPLTGILSNAQAAEIMIDRGQYDLDEIAEILADIATDAQRAGELIRNLRDLYREQKTEFSSVAVNAVVEETLRLLRSEFVLQGVGIATAYAPSNPTVEGNWVQIQQILVNLIMNGMDAMKETASHARHLRVVTEQQAERVKVWVEDSGEGIEETVIDRMFEPLATWKPTGTGMGLAICNSIIVAHGGSMWAENRNDGGAIVGFQLAVLSEDP